MNDLASEQTSMLSVEIRVKGELDAHWSRWLGGLAISHVGQGQTRLAGVIADQPALYGVLTKLRDLDLPLVLVRLEEPGPAGRRSES